MLFDYQKQQELQEARKKESEEKARREIEKYSAGKNKGMAENTIRDAKNLVRDFSPAGLFSLFFQINLFADWPYFLALLFALLKDLSDFVLAIGPLFFVSSILGFLASIFIGLMMILASINNPQASKNRKIIRFWLVLGGGMIAETFLVGLNFFPLETFTVILLWMMLLSSRKQAEEEKRQAGRLAEAY